MVINYVLYNLYKWDETEAIMTAVVFELCITYHRTYKKLS